MDPAKHHCRSQGRTLLMAVRLSFCTETNVMVLWATAKIQKFFEIERYQTPDNISSVPSHSRIHISTFAVPGSLVGLNVGGKIIAVQQFGRELVCTGSTRGAAALPQFRLCADLGPVCSILKFWGLVYLHTREQS